MTSNTLPNDLKIENLSGRWMLNKAQSDDVAKTMEVQGLSWLVRKVIAAANLTLTITHDGLDLIMVSAATGTPVTTTEIRHTNWTEVENKIIIFGTIKGRSRILSLEPGKVELEMYNFLHETGCENTDDLIWLGDGWLAEGDDEGGYKLLETQGKCLEQKWFSHQIWGFQIIDGQRKHVRKFLTWRGNKKTRAMLVYDYLGPGFV